jgi:hypothetical protein
MVTSPNSPRITQQDQPFWSLATGPLAPGATLGTGPQQYSNPFPNGLMTGTLNNTLFAQSAAVTNSVTNGIFDVTPSNTVMSADQQHPYIRSQLLSKIFNNVTTRSNCFAVWLTVGFFEVVDDTTQPVKLGAEIGKDQNRQIRHRMFAIIDRTQLQSIFPATGTGPIVSQTAIALGPTPATVSPVIQSPPGSGTFVPAVSGTTDQGSTWKILPGMILNVTSQKTVNGTTTIYREQVVVQSVQGNTFSAVFTINHTPDTTNPASPVYPQFIAQGNPGPQAIPFNPHNSPLIAHFSID